MYNIIINIRTQLTLYYTNKLRFCIFDTVVIYLHLMLCTKILKIYMFHVSISIPIWSHQF